MARADQILNGPPAACSSRNLRLSDCYKRGLHLARCEKNYDYAHVMFTECVLHDPGSLQFVEAMIQNLRARTPHAKKTRSLLFRSKNRTLKKALQRQDWNSVFSAGIDCLQNDPWDVAALRALADACAALHYNEIELTYLKQALDAAPKNVDVRRHCARSLARMGQFDQAIACWHRVETLVGKDEEAARMISILAEEKLKYPGGCPPVRRSENVPAPVPEPENVQPDIVFSPTQKLEQAIADDPKCVTNYLDLARLLLSSNRFQAAETVLVAAVAACGEQRELAGELERVRHLSAERQRQLTEERSIEQQLDDAPLRVPWFELLLAAALTMLVVQLVPSARAFARTIVDMRHWSRTGWISFNIAVLVGLVLFRFAPDIRTMLRWRRRRQKKSATNGR